MLILVAVDNRNPAGIIVATRFGQKRNDDKRVWSRRDRQAAPDFGANQRMENVLERQSGAFFEKSNFAHARAIERSVRIDHVRAEVVRDLRDSGLPASCQGSRDFISVDDIGAEFVEEIGGARFS